MSGEGKIDSPRPDGMPSGGVEALHDHLHPAEEVFQSLAAAASPDWSLIELIELADIPGPSVSITVVLPGAIVSGDLINREVWADNLDRQIREGIERAKPADPAEEPGQWEQYRDVVMDRLAFKEKIAQTREEDAELLKELNKFREEGRTWDELPGELARKWVRTQAWPQFSLANATIQMGGQPPYRPGNGLIRVRLEQISAWWLGKAAAR
jgi:hypothetical protein